MFRLSWNDRYMRAFKRLGQIVFRAEDSTYDTVSKFELNQMKIRIDLAF